MSDDTATTGANCLDEVELLRFVRGKLADEPRQAVLDHLAGCEHCRHVVAFIATDGDAAPTDDGGRSRPSMRELVPGERLGRYQIVERVGHGGMGVVYAAYDPQLHRTVALKLLMRRLGDSTLTVRVNREAQAMAQLSHPNVVAIHDVGSDDGQLFIAMEFVQGTTLRRWLAAEPRPWRLVLEKLLDAGRGLAAAHAAGLVHRDFKLDNVLVGDDGVTRVTDFGLARLADDDVVTPLPPLNPSELALTSTITRTGTVMGSAGYIAPETAFEGLSTPASDQFSFCVSAHEALLGSRPFQGDTYEGVARAARDGVVTPPLKPQGAPAWLVEHLRRGLSADPAKRFGSMGELLERLRDDPVPRRRRRVAFAATALALAVTGSVAGYRHLTACDGLEREVQPAWSAPVAERARAAFERVGVGEQGWRRVEGLLDAYASKWLTARLEVCQAARADELAPQTLELRLECLAARRDELASLATAFANADRTTVNHAYAAVSQLPSVEECQNRSILESPLRVVAPDQRAAVTQLRERLVSARTALLIGDSARAAKEAEPVFKSAVAVGPPVLVAQSALVYGQALALEERRECLEVFERGLFAATASAEEELVLRLLAAVITERGHKRHQPGEARALAPIANGLTTRLSGSRVAVGLFHEAVGDVEWEAGDYEAALRSYRQGVAAMQVERGDKSLDIARIKSSLGWALSDVGRVEEAAAELEDAKKMAEALVGPEHVGLLPVWKALGNLASVKGDAEAGSEADRHLLTLLVTEAGPDSERLVVPLLNSIGTLMLTAREVEARARLAEVERLIDLHPAPVLRVHAFRARSVIERISGHLAEAEAAAKQTVVLSKDLRVGNASDHEVSLEALALCQLESGHFSEALATVTEAVPLVSETLQPTLEGLRGRALLGLFHTVEALGVLDVALRQWPEGIDPVERGRATLALADAQWALGKKPEARETAERSRPFLTPFAPFRGLTDAWLAAHP